MLGGRFWRYGRVLAAEWSGRGVPWRAYWFAPQDGSPGGLYTEHAEGATRVLLRSPLPGKNWLPGLPRLSFWLSFLTLRWALPQNPDSRLI